MSKFLNWNGNGSWTEVDYCAHEDKVTVTKKNDVQPILDLAKDERNSGINDTIKGDFFFSKYAVLPASVQIELHKKGIRLGDSRDTGRLLKEINENYPNLKMTNLVHNEP